MKVEVIVSVRNLWAGAYWEVWPDPYRLDVWVAVPFVSLHLWRTK